MLHDYGKPDFRADKSERVKYNAAGLPIYFRKGLLSKYPNFTAESHWHDDVELIVVLSGNMKYAVNGEVVKLNEGDGIFINSRQFHYGFSDERKECVFLCLLFHPVLLSASQFIEQNYVNPLLNLESVPYKFLKKDDEKDEKIFSDVNEIFTARDLKKLSLVYDIWDNLYEGLGKFEQKKVNSYGKLNVFKQMINFIQYNYKESVTLSEIAAAGAVCKTECCAVFKKYVNLTPIAYLNDYRLRKSLELLVKTDMTVCEICYEVGFSGASYFSETFKKVFGCTPIMYREANHDVNEF